MDVCYGMLEVISSDALVQRDAAETQRFSTAAGVRGSGSRTKARSVREAGWHQWLEAGSGGEQQLQQENSLD